jgi:hypothetical protein
MNSRGLRRVHLYLGTLFAPVLLLFASSGAWQIYRLNDAKKDGSYTPPKIVKTLSAVHKNQTRPGDAEEDSAQGLCFRGMPGAHHDHLSGHRHGRIASRAAP